ncbi:MAG: helix-turn-helix domain-containing protein [Chitinophagaceae bacterium]
MSTQKNSQERFFEQLKKKLSSDTLIANELAAALNISTSEAYNKLKGNSSLTLQQLELLCNKYHLNFEIKPQATINTCTVKFTSFHTGDIDIGKYLESLNNVMHMLSTGGIRKLSCATDDIPFYHLFKYPELAAFKIHFWNNRIVKNTGNQGAAFDFKKVNKKYIHTAYELYKIYQSIPCVEIWTKSHLLITIDQIRYAAESHVLKDKNLGRLLCEQLIATLNDIESYAVKSSKTEDGKTLFDWYFCDVVGSVTYLAETAEKRFCFLRFNTFNNFQSDDELLCMEVDMWLKSLLNDATGFSGHASKHRNIYLQEAIKTCEELSNMF